LPMGKKISGGLVAVIGVKQGKMARAWEAILSAGLKFGMKKVRMKRSLSAIIFA